MGSHSVTCHPIQVNTPRFNPSQTGRYSIYLPHRDGRLSWPIKDHRPQYRVNNVPHPSTGNHERRHSGRQQWASVLLLSTKSPLSPTATTTNGREWQGVDILHNAGNPVYCLLSVTWPLAEQILECYSLNFTSRLTYVLHSKIVYKSTFIPVLEMCLWLNRQHHGTQHGGIWH